MLRAMRNTAPRCLLVNVTVLEPAEPVMLLKLHPYTLRVSMVKSIMYSYWVTVVPVSFKMFWHIVCLRQYPKHYQSKKEL